MKKVILTLVLFGAFFCMANIASAGIPIFYSNGEKVDITKTLPQEAVVNNNEHVNLGTMYKQFSIFGIPVWNYGETKYVLINDKKDKYCDLSAEIREMLKTNFTIELPEKPTIGFWNKIGGKIVLGVILAAIFIFFVTRKGRKEAEVLKIEE